MLGEKKHVKVHHKGWCQVWNVGIQLKDISNMYMYNIIRQSRIYIYICMYYYIFIYKANIVYEHMFFIHNKILHRNNKYQFTMSLFLRRKKKIISGKIIHWILPMH